MALKTLLLRSKLEKANMELERLRSKDDDFSKREAELEQAIAEVSEETSEEEREELETQVGKFQEEKDEHEKEKKNLEEEIEKIEGEIAEEEKRNSAATNKPEKREGRTPQIMENRTRFFGMSVQERDAFFMRDDVKDFLQRTRELASQKRAVSGSDLLVPTVMLDLIRENIASFSKLYRHVNVKPVPGKARQTISGTIPEGIWTEMVGALNELEFMFTDVEVDGYKVGGFIPIFNSVLEDSDIDLGKEIITGLGQAIGLALDKAILYGTGTKMPLGIVTRLAQTEKPSNYKSTAREWINLSTSNLLKITGKTDLALYKELISATGAAKGTYSRGEKFWCMNENTKASLVSNALSFNSAGAITAGIENKMPVIGGDIEELNFIPDGVIIGGYGDLYLLAERDGTSINSSEHVRFLQDQTVFKGTARYDGVPTIAEGFVAIGINGVVPTANAVTFAVDKVNTPSGE